MTAEVAVMNRLAIALAADSAATITTDAGPKVYNTANKLFTLSKFAPVGLLVYNVPEINGVPVEVIVKEFRERLGRERFKTLDEYANRFSEFLQAGPPMTEDSREINFSRLVRLCLRRVYLRALRLRGSDEQPHEDFNEYLKRSVSALERAVTKQGVLDAFAAVDPKVVWKERRDWIKKIHERVIETFKNEHDFPELPKELSKSIEIVALSTVFSKIQMPSPTGIVIAGYGDEEYFPSYIAYETDGFTPYGLRRTPPHTRAITHKNLAEVGAFAQGDMIQVFMEGIDHDNLEYIEAALEEIFSGLPKVIGTQLEIGGHEAQEQLKRLDEGLKETLKSFHEDCAKFRREQFTTPVIEAIRHLEKNDLASMAESLVAITALKRRVTLGADSVGGPIDVAVISKGDGFIWIKRKHYFDIELNRSFMQKYLPPANAGETP